MKWKQLFYKLACSSQGPFVSAERVYNLHSGERQVGEKLEEIRYDHRARYQLIVDTLKSKNVDGVSICGLDLFCATGYGAWMLSSELGCSMFGVDASLEAVTFANKHFSNEKTFYAHKVFPFSLPIQTFDFISCIESIEHVKDHRSLLAEVIKSLKVGGYLFLSTPNENMLSLELNPNPFHSRHFTREEIDLMMSSFPEIEMVGWFGQNLYQVDSEGIVTGGLGVDEMGLVKGQEGQLQLYVFKVR